VCSSSRCSCLPRLPTVRTCRHFLCPSRLVAAAGMDRACTRQCREFSALFFVCPHSFVLPRASIFAFGRTRGVVVTSRVGRKALMRGGSAPMQRCMALKVRTTAFAPCPHPRPPRTCAHVQLATSLPRAAMPEKLAAATPAYSANFTTCQVPQLEKTRWTPPSHACVRVSRVHVCVQCHRAQVQRQSEAAPRRAGRP
jgi:hypothetical protein